MGWANTLAFAPHGGLLAAMTWDGDVVVARAPASVALRTGFRPDGCVADFAPSSARTAGASWRLPPEARASGTSTASGCSCCARRPALPLSPASPPPPSAATGGLLRRARPAAVARLGASNDSGQRSGIRAATHRSVASRRRTASCSTRAARSLPPTEGRGGRRPANACARSTGSSGSARTDVWLWCGATGPPQSCGSAQERPWRRSAGSGIQARPALSATFSPDGRRIVTLATPSVSGRASGKPLGRLGHVGERCRRLLVQQGRPARARDLLGRAGRDIQRRGRLTRLVAGREEPRRDLARRRPRRRRERRRQRRCRRPERRSAASPSRPTPPSRSSAQRSGRRPALLVAADAAGDVHVLRCEICASEGALLTRARARLGLVSKFHPQRPPMAGVI